MLLPITVLLKGRLSAGGTFATVGYARKPSRDDFKYN
jgi:hypothetical protein